MIDETTLFRGKESSIERF